MSARSRLLPVLALLTALVASSGAASAQSIEEARRQRETLQGRLDAAAEELATVEARVGSLADEAAGLEDRRAALAATASEAEGRVAERVREMYKRGVDTPLLQLLSGDDATEALERAALAGQLLSADRVAIETAVAARRRASAVSEELARRLEDLADARRRQEDVLAALQEDLEAARALEERLVEEERRRQEEARRRVQEEAEARRRAAREAAQAEAAEQAPTAPTAPAPTGGGRACPVAQPHSFTDTWGAPRSGGRSHQGVDVLAGYGTPVYAMVSGIWDAHAYGSSAGHWAILRGDDGHDYWYMHLQSHTVGDGARVGAGQQTGTVGDTGNAAGTPHLHFEYHPGGGGPVNPYPITRAAC
jgi:murein DD-endopeptidase MepM/ murein hydrolase activator NlpD